MEMEIKFGNKHLTGNPEGEQTQCNCESQSQTVMDWREWEVRKWTPEVWVTLSRMEASNKKKHREVEGMWGQGRVRSALFVSSNAKPYTYPMTITQNPTSRKQLKHHEKENE